MPTEEEIAKWQRVRPIMNQILNAKGLVEVVEDKVLVTGMKGPLEDGWQHKVEGFVARIPVKSDQGSAGRTAMVARGDAYAGGGRTGRFAGQKS